MRLLYQLGPGFERITPGALWADARLGMSYVRLLDGCAVVSDADWIRASTRRIGAFMPCPVRVYHNDEHDDAIAWLRLLPKHTDVSTRDIAKAYVGGVCAAAESLAQFVISKTAMSR
jgi:hypothetical protein